MSINDVNYTIAVKDVINGIIGKQEDIKYLEIGVDEGETFDHIRSSAKHGVDPYGGSPSITHKMTSQMFFAMNQYFYKNTYDVIFIDGCHMAEVIQQEVMQSLRILNPGGVILLHDTVPNRKVCQLILEEDYEPFLRNLPKETSDVNSFREYINKHGWKGANGDSWKAVHFLSKMKGIVQLEIMSILQACCTIITCDQDLRTGTFSAPYFIDNDQLTWEFLEKNYQEILNPKLFEEVVALLNDRILKSKGS